MGGETLLCCACGGGDRKYWLARLFIEHSADASTKINAGIALLHRAYEIAHLMTIKSLVENGADPSAKSDDEAGETTLHEACSSRFREPQIPIIQLGYQCTSGSWKESALASSMPRWPCGGFQAAAREWSQSQSLLCQCQDLFKNAPSSSLREWTFEGSSGFVE